MTPDYPSEKCGARARCGPSSTALREQRLRRRASPARHPARTVNALLVRQISHWSGKAVCCLMRKTNFSPLREFLLLHILRLTLAPAAPATAPGPGRLGQPFA